MKPKNINPKIHSGNDIISMPLHQIGGKAKGLGFLVENGLKTPEFYVLTFDTIQLIEHDDASLSLLLNNWKLENNISSNELWAVRSSAANEDGVDKSFAGQFTSVLNLKNDELIAGIKTVLESYNQSNAYSEKKQTFGIIIQKMLNPTYSGVFFTRNPILLYNDQPTISIIPGIGDKLVSGELDGYSISFENDIPKYTSETNIEGEYFENNQRINIVCSSQEIKNELDSHISSMLYEGKRLEKKKNSPLDFEFAIQNGILYWLQIRPITTRKINPKIQVWDNTSSEANYPGVTLPLSISFVKKTMFQAYAGGAKELKFNPKVLKENLKSLENMCGEIEGALYYNVTAWQTLIYLMPFGSRLSKKLPSIWGMEKTDFQLPDVQHSKLDKLKIAFGIFRIILKNKRAEKIYLNLFKQHISDFNEQSLQDDSLEELKSKYLKIENELGSKWLVPVLNGFNTMLVFSLLKRKIRNSKIEAAYPNFINDILFSEGEVKSVQLVRRFQRLLEEIYHSDELTQFFNEHNAQEIWDQIPLKFSNFYQKIQSYIQEFGNRTDQGELKLETINYHQNPTLFIQFIQASLKGFKPIEKSKDSFNYREIINNNYRFNIINRWIFNKLIKSTINRMKARENYRFMRTDTFSVIRTLFLQMGKVLVAENYLENERDVLYLELDELLNLTSKKDFKSLVENRKKTYQNYKNKEQPNRYIQVNDALFGIHPENVELEGNELKGIACCSGIVTNQVIVINDETDFNQDFSNAILVANYFEPGWINLFYQANGIISERGNLLSHTAIICRELNLPSIIGIKGIMKKVKTGDTITMDGERGIVTILEHE